MTRTRCRLLLDTMNDGFGIQDQDGIVTYVNDRLCEMFGYAREELMRPGACWSKRSETR